MFLVNLGWVIFRAENLVYAGNYIKNMFGVGARGLWSSEAFMFLKEYGVFFIAGIIFSMPIGKRVNRLVVDGKWEGKWMNGIYLLMMAMLLICVTYLVKGTYNPFIYFNF